MHILDRELRPWLHGIICVLLSLCVMWTVISFQNLHYSLVDGVNNILYYPEKPFMELRNIVKYSSNWILERASLRERVSILELRNQQMSEALQQSGVVVPSVRGLYVSAKITLRYPEEWWQQLRIDRGKSDGIKLGSAVTSEGFLIGRVARLGDNFAWVELITDSSFLIAAAVDETRDLGVLNGENNGKLRLLYVPEDRKLKSGMKVSTSIMSELVPPGIPIGKIIAADKVKDGFAEIKIQAGAHLTQLYSVEVFTNQEIKR